MRRPAQYRTKQRDLIVAYLSSLEGRHTTAGQMMAHFRARGIPVGTATLYRHLEALAQDGRVKKYLMDDSAGACYEYLGNSEAARRPYHFKCERCGALFHMQCDILDALERHIGDEHRFELDAGKTVFYGRCENCAPGQGESAQWEEVL